MKQETNLRSRTTSEGQKWMISKREHPCLVLFPLEIMFANTFSSEYLYLWNWEVCANVGGSEEVVHSLFEGFPLGCSNCGIITLGLLLLLQVTV